MKANPTLADVKRAVEQFFAPDLSLRKNERTGRYSVDLVKHFPVRNQLMSEAGIARLDDTTLDRFLAAAGRHGLTIEMIGA